MARPTRLSPKVADTIVEMVRATGNYADAARAAGVGPRLFAEWRRVGLAMMNGPDDPKYPANVTASVRAMEALTRRVVEAEGQWATQTRAMIQAAAQRTSTTRVEQRRQVLGKDGKVVELVDVREEVRPPDWRAAAWLIEQHSGSATQRLEVSGPDGGAVVVSLEERAAAARARIAALRQAGDDGADELLEG